MWRVRTGGKWAEMRSLLDLDLPPLVDAERRLDELSSQRAGRLKGAVVLTILAVVAAVVLPELWIVLAAGALAALGTAGTAFARRQALISALLQVRDAYRLEPVSKAGARFATRERRERLALWLRKIARAAEGGEVRAAYTTAPLDRRVLERKERLLAIAAALEDRRDELHPAGVAIVHRLLTRPSVSPLFNQELQERILDDALHRVEASTDRGSALAASPR
jgi:hypothetical protein